MWCEKEECPYCDGDAEEQAFLSGDDTFGSDEAVKLDLNTKSIDVEMWVGAFTSNPERVTTSIYVNYCPMCGRALHE